MFAYDLKSFNILELFVRGQRCFSIAGGYCIVSEYDLLEASNLESNGILQS